jgi:Domain of unknown function (DUF4145)
VFMAAMKCPHCGAYAHMTRRWWQGASGSAHLGYQDYVPPMGCFTCDACEMPMVARYFDEPTAGIERSWPLPTGQKQYPDVPRHLASTANEAHVCLGAGSPRGSVTLARSVVEAVAKDKGIAGRNVQAKIDALYEAGHISEAMREAAHEIRFAGNEAAHGGDVVMEQLGTEDAQEIVGLMDAILERVYQEPARVARIREKRELRRQRAESAHTAAAAEPTA